MKQTLTTLKWEIENTTVTYGYNFTHSSNVTKCNKIQGIKDMINNIRDS
jgi:hypothetical protein